MIENLLESLNILLLQHPHLIGVMRILFWAKSLLLVGVFCVFVYFVYSDDQVSGKKKAAKREPEGVFIA